MKRIFGLLCLALVLFSFAACGGGEKADPNFLTIWSFTDELDDMVHNYYAKAYPDMKFEYSLTATEQFPNKLDPVLASGQGAPDIFALEAAFVRKYVESGLLLDLTDIYEANKHKLLAYPVEIGTYEGRVYGMSWQACPGAMFYRRSLAIKYLGTDDPAVVQSYFTNGAKFLETAALLKELSGGACVVVSSGGDLYNPFLGARKQPWVVNGKLFVDPAMEQYMEISKTIWDNRFEGQVGQWSEGWFAGMRGELQDASGRNLEVFSYFLPTWGLHYVLKTNAPDTSGDWAMIPGPYPYRWGGTWIGAYKGTKNPEAAKELIRYLTVEDSFLEAWARDKGDMVSNLAVVDKIKGSYSEPFLGGQNHYAEFAEMAKHVDGKLVQGTDQAVEGLFQEATNAYKLSEKSMEQALAEFRAQAETTLGL
ncbi:MAG: ABC transporter substrate-binding protein [Treponema sp.]|nr:ABC transporter substrate-binding protein [Treponema sp.]